VHGRAEDIDVCPRCLTESRGALSVMLAPDPAQESRDRRGVLSRLLREGLESIAVGPPWVARGGR
jgi:hypothetical protein